MLFRRPQGNCEDDPSTEAHRSDFPLVATSVHRGRAFAPASPPSRSLPGEHDSANAEVFDEAHNMRDWIGCPGGGAMGQVVEGGREEIRSSYGGCRGKLVRIGQVPSLTPQFILPSPLSPPLPPSLPFSGTHCDRDDDPTPSSSPISPFLPHAPLRPPKTTGLMMRELERALVFWMGSAGTGRLPK